MKKTSIVIAILTLAAIVCIFAVCSNTTTSNVDTIGPDTNSSLVSTVQPFEMEESELIDLYLKLYAEKSEDEFFISDEESMVYRKYNFSIRNQEDGLISFYDSMYNEIRNYYYPIVLPDTEEVVIAYVNEYGCLSSYNATRESTEYYRNIHVPEGTEYIDYQSNYSVVYTGSSVELWEFGTKTAEVKIQNNSVYTGHSDWEGYIFRNGGDVYSVKLEMTEDENLMLLCEPIAHGVKEVIVTDYKLNSDAWSQPIFLMEDGSIKVYCSWSGDQNATRDDASHLTPPQYEGGEK